MSAKKEDVLKGLIINGKLCHSGKPMTEEDALKLLREAALSPGGDHTMLMHEARLIMLGAIANKKRGVQLKGRPRGSKELTDAELLALVERDPKARASLGKRMASRLARLERK